MIKTSKKSKIIINTILSIFGIIWIIPLFFVFMNLFKTKQEYNLGSLWQLPESMNFEIIANNFRNLIANKLFLSFGSTFLYCGVGASVGVFVALLAGYGLTHTSVKHKNFWFLVIYSGTVFPFESYLIPIYRAYYKVGLYNTRTGMLLFFMALCIPFAMFVFRNFFLGVDTEICEAAKIDGANSWQTLIKIMIPMAKAPLAIVLLQQFTAAWNNLMFGLTFTKSANIRPVMASLSLLGNANIPLMFLACIFVSLPAVVLFFLLRDQLVVGYAYTTK